MFYRVENHQLKEYGDNFEFFDSQENVKELPNINLTEFIKIQDKYELNKNEELEDISQTPEYIAHQLELAKQAKIQELLQKSSQKRDNATSTITINLPATLKKGDEIKQVTSYKLLTNTSSGNILQALQLINILPPAFMTDTLVTDDGYMVVGLATEVTHSGITTTQANLILLTAIQVQGQITLYLRDTKERILACTTIEDLDDINISFDEF